MGRNDVRSTSGRHIVTSGDYRQLMVEISKKRRRPAGNYAIRAVMNVRKKAIKKILSVE